MTADVPLIYAKVIELAELLGVRNIKELSGTWGHQFNDKDWRLYANGHSVPVLICDELLELPPYCIALSWRGWAVAVISPVEGETFWKLEQEIIDALDAEIERVRKERKK
jgi:hypothetical protein